MINPKLDKERIDKLLDVRTFLIKNVIDKLNHFGDSIYEVPSIMIEYQNKDLIFDGFRYHVGYWWISGCIHGEMFVLNNEVILFPRRNKINQGIVDYRINSGFIRFVDDEWFPIISDINYEYNLKLSNDYFNWSDDEILMFRMCV